MDNTIDNTDEFLWDFPNTSWDVVLIGIRNFMEKVELEKIEKFVDNIETNVAWGNLEKTIHHTTLNAST
jgi:hypothetical protein